MGTGNLVDLSAGWDCNTAVCIRERGSEYVS
jgi:hypothetical protein